MQKIFRLLLDWSEVWATLIPVTVWLFHRHQPRYMRPVIFYFFFALLINLTGNVIAAINSYFPGWKLSNNPLYNIHSVVRFICFSLFFIQLGKGRMKTIFKLLPIVALLIFALNFTLIDDFFYYWHLSGNLLTGEAYLLLVYCLLYYLYKLQYDNLEITQEPDFWLVTGLAIYVVVNFFVFLFYVPMVNLDYKLANQMWDVHNYAFIIFCLLTAKALYDAPRYQHSV